MPGLRDQAGDTDTSASFPSTAMKDLRGSGLLGLLVPASYGGMGGGLGDLAAVAQTLATGCTSTAMIWAMHCQQVDAIVRHGGDGLRARILPRISAGHGYLASVTTEPGSHGRLLSSDSPLTVDNDRLEIDRTAPIVTGGEAADGFLVTMRESPDAPRHRVTLVYADREQLTVNRTGDWDPLGMRGTASAPLHLSGRVPLDQVVGAPGGFREVAVETLVPAGHIAWASTWLGTAAGALRDVVAAYRSPSSGLRFDTTSDLAAERLARIRMDVDVVRALLDSVVRLVEAARQNGGSVAGPAAQIAINNLKVEAAERTFAAADRLVQIAGLTHGYGRRAVLPLERHFRNLRSARLNFADDRLLAITGRLVVLDRTAGLPGAST